MAQAVTALKRSSLPWPGCHRWLGPAQAVHRVLLDTRLPIREKSHCVASPASAALSGPFAKARADLHSVTDGPAPRSFVRIWRRGAGTSREAHGDSEWTAGRSAAPQSWEKLGRVDRTQTLTLQSKRGLGEDPVLSPKHSREHFLSNF